MDNLKVIFTVYVDENGNPYLKWAKDVPDEWKMMLRNAFGGSFNELPNE